MPPSGSKKGGLAVKCPECGAEIYDDAKKCPFCKLPMINAENDKFKDFDFKYTITSAEQIKLIRDSVNEVAEGKPKVSAVKKYVRVRRRSAKKTDEKNTGKRFKKEKTVRGLNEKTARGETKKTERGLNEETARGAKEKPAHGLRLPNRETVFRIGTAAAMCAAAALVIFCVCAAVSAVSKRNPNAAAYTYIKDNSMYLIYNGKTAELTQSAVSRDYLRRSEEASLPENAASISENGKTSWNAAGGRLTYFFEDYDPDTESGTLAVIENGKAKKITRISEAVHNSVIMSADGERILYLQSTDKNGDMGVLYYYRLGMDGPFKISTDIDCGTFAFTADGNEAMFLQNLNRVEMKGDLFVKNLRRLKEEKLKLDSDVCRVFGTNGKSTHYLYAKEFSADDGAFEIYSADRKNTVLRLGERTKLAPYVPKTADIIFCYGLADDGTSNLYRVEIKSGKKERIASGVNRVYGMTKNEKTVIYDRVFDGKVSDCYAYTSGKQPQKLAGSISVDYETVGTAPQFAVTPDLSQIVYISDFDAARGGGTLYSAKMKGGKVSEPKMLAEDVFSCYIADGGKIVFTKDYSTSRKVFDVYVMSGKSARLLKDEVNPEMFEAEVFGNNIYYIADYNISGDFGTLMKMNLKGKAEEICKEVYSFRLCGNGDLLLVRNLNSENGEFDLYLARNGKKSAAEIEKKVSGI